MSSSQTHILLFDGVCNLCNRVVQFVIKRDTKATIKFASLQSDAGQVLLKKVGLPTDNFTSIVLIINNNHYLKSTAGLRVLKKLGGVWKLLYVFIFLPKPLRDFIYDLIAKNRYQMFGKRDVCMLPTDDLKQRFLS